MWSGSHPLCRTSSTKQQGFIQPVFTPLVDADGMKKKKFFIIIYYYYVVALRLARLRVFCRWCVKRYRKVVRSTWSMWALSGPGLSVSQWLFTRLFSFHFTLLRGSSLWHRPLVCGPSVEASHDARLDILVGDLLVVVVRAAARWVHRRGRHGVEGEDELLSVTHAWRLGMVPGNTCEKVF